MRKVKLTKDVIQRNTVIFGLGKKQIIGMALTCVLAGVILALAFVFGWNMNLIGSIIFTELLVGASVFIIRINGRSLFRMLIEAFFTIEDVRYYVKGGLNSNEEKTKR
ncbi:MAG: hypothetical protein UHK60_03615 [Acutalibacteraceae bacterium]|nr:hypothetical protein [Acutalibacteraceae bacterium]